MPYKDPKKARAAWRRWYARGNSKAIQAGNKRRRDALRAKVRAYKADRGCGRCPERHPACLDFHHKDGDEKEIAIGEAVHREWAWDRLLAEITKCEILCSNCHRKEHDSESEVLQVRVVDG